ncbi:MAG: hypothetical protein KKF44_06740 [Nanoarchaeota archaeon]|nr:hypothetical protein [Nanoarchaeota archaeon]
MIKKTADKSKKGQYYLFAVIILCSVVFMGVVNSISIRDNDEGFQELYDNYVAEAYIVIDNSIFNEQATTELFENFTLSYMDYAKTKKIDLGILYVLIYSENEGFVVNYLNSPAYISTDTVFRELVPVNSESIINLATNLTIEVDSLMYSFNITEGENTKLKLIFRKE